MAQIQKPNVTAFKVQLTEYERGWGQRPWETIYFDNEEEARRFAEDYNRKHNTQSSAPDWYVRADYAGKVS
jgi:hypothetical protein